ncbi:alpha/beta hydrolase [Plantactinospora soyae]|uniref:Pimeloyl-ACP methyl ester carboxylesterase n=1 Tax=Plantactinospora soyae TaxID=1544732 RepID=A0A927R0X1_9ACTN|nr:alpha/beta hydrolase [Plantactinospora soyae]MBE1492060.1 pimeloyl-ACP methyl ester carboxylesterase [Plantactinospora soyae]
MRCRPAVRGTVVGLLALGLLVPPPPAGAAPVAAAPARFVDAYPEVARAMRAAGTPYADWVGTGRSFLAFDPHGDGLAVEVLGDLGTADRIAVLVPGVDNTLRDFDRGLGGVSRRAPSVQARILYDEIRAAQPDARVAVLAWLGYDPPNGLGRAAARQESARPGAQALLDLVRTLARHRPAATVTLIGHSYGALVIGLAAPALPAQVTGIVTVGGVGMGVDEVGELHTGATVWAAEAPDDWIRWLPPLQVLGFGHGVRPAAPGFGARRMPVDGVTGHDGYLVSGTGTLRAVALLTLGRTGSVAGAAVAAR